MDLYRCCKFKNFPFQKCTTHSQIFRCIPECFSENFRLKSKGKKCPISAGCRLANAFKAYQHTHDFGSLSTTDKSSSPTRGSLALYFNGERLPSERKKKRVRREELFGKCRSSSPEIRLSPETVCSSGNVTFIKYFKGNEGSSRQTFAAKEIGSLAEKLT